MNGEKMQTENEDYYDQANDEEKSESVYTRFRSYWQYRRRIHDAELCITCEHWKPSRKFRLNAETGVCTLVPPPTKSDDDPPCHAYKYGQRTDYDDSCAHHARRWNRNPPAEDREHGLVYDGSDRAHVCAWNACKNQWCYGIDPWTGEGKYLPASSRWLPMPEQPTEPGLDRSVGEHEAAN